MYEIKKNGKKNKKNFWSTIRLRIRKNNIALSIGEVNGHFYLKIKVKKVRKKSEKKARKKIEPSCYDPKYFSYNC